MATGLVSLRLFFVLWFGLLHFKSKRYLAIWEFLRLNAGASQVCDRETAVLVTYTRCKLGLKIKRKGCWLALKRAKCTLALTPTTLSALHFAHSRDLGCHFLILCIGDIALCVKCSVAMLFIVAHRCFSVLILSIQVDMSSSYPFLRRVRIEVHALKILLVLQ